MHGHDLEKMLEQQLEVADDGFTDAMMRALPPQKKSMMAGFPFKVWIPAMATVLTLAFMGPQSWSWSLLAIPVVILLTHLDVEQWI